MNDWSVRSREKERMDDLDGEVQRLHQTLSDLSVVNRWLSGYRRIMSKTFLRHMMSEPTREWTLLDAGCGGCDIAAWLLSESSRRNLMLEVHAVDLDPRAVEFARSFYGSVLGLQVHYGDIFEIVNDLPPADFIYAQHFLHHLADDAVLRFFRDIAARAKYQWVVNDLLRSRISHALFEGVTFWRRSRSYVCDDGLISIRKGFTPQELENFLRQAGVPGTARFQLPGRVIACGRP